MRRCHLPVALLALLAAASSARSDDGPYLATGVKIGEVTPNSALIWVRLSSAPARVPGAPKDDPKDAADDAIAQLGGAVPGRSGLVRLLVSRTADLAQPRVLGPIAVGAETDFTHQFALGDLTPLTQYHFQVETLAKEGGPIGAKLSGSFTTAPPSDAWQDIRFAVMTCQGYRDLDDPAGYHIYPAMLDQKLAFLAATGDTVYYDSDPPIAKTVAMARHHWNRMYSLPRLVEFHRQVPCYWEKDDHDTWKNDCWPAQKGPDESSTSLSGPLNFAKGLKIFREQVPMGEKTYRTFRWGQGLQIWLVEGRDFRSPNNMPDGPEKSIWGQEQMAWLKASLLASDAAFRVLLTPTPIVGPDRKNKADNLSNETFAFEGNAFRAWTKEHGLTNLISICGDRHWQYHSIDPASGLNEFSVGPTSDQHAGGTPGENPELHKFHRVKGGFLTVTVSRPAGTPTAAFRLHDVHGSVVYEQKFTTPGK